MNYYSVITKVPNKSITRGILTKHHSLIPIMSSHPINKSNLPPQSLEIFRPLERILVLGQFWISRCRYSQNRDYSSCFGRQICTIVAQIVFEYNNSW